MATKPLMSMESAHAQAQRIVTLTSAGGRWTINRAFYPSQGGSLAGAPDRYVVNNYDQARAVAARWRTQVALVLMGMYIDRAEDLIAQAADQGIPMRARDLMRWVLQQLASGGAA